MTLESLIKECIELKKGDKQFALFYLVERTRFNDIWRADIGNELSVVSLGEVSGEFSAEGSTPIEALERLRDKLRTQK